MATLPKSFYLRPTVEIARALLGKVLRHRTREGVVSGRIVETEAYLGAEDLASHACRGPTPRCEMMFEEGGVAYVYSTRHHFCFNVVTGKKGEGSAVLIRALEPLEGIELMKKRRGLEELTRLCNGPANLCQSLGIRLEENGLDLKASELQILEGQSPPEIIASTRIGITKAVELPYRFLVADNPHVSRKPGKNQAI